MRWEHLPRLCRIFAAATLLPLLVAEPAWGWGADGHRMINRLAAANLPSDVPAFLRNGNALDTIEFLGPEPDRWRDGVGSDLVGAPEHFLDLEYSNLLPKLPTRRYEFVGELGKAQAKHPELPLAPEKVGMQPWATAEMWQRLKVGLRQYRELQAANADTRPAETAVLVYAGLLGHFVADGSQPLHTTYQYNGWTGPNPNGYTTAHKIHSQFESTFVSANIKLGEVQPLVAASKPELVGDVFADYVSYLQHSHTAMEKVYQLEKAGELSGVGSPEAKSFTEERLAAGAIELRNLIYTAWVRSGDPIQRYTGPE